MNNKLKIGIFMIILGELLYLAHTYIPFSSTNIGDFISGFLLGASISINLIGIILTVFCVAQSDKKNRQ